jgi:hypothetical protein
MINNYTNKIMINTDGIIFQISFIGSKDECYSMDKETFKKLADACNEALLEKK